MCNQPNDELEFLRIVIQAADMKHLGMTHILGLWLIKYFSDNKKGEERDSDSPIDVVGDKDYSPLVHIVSSTISE